MIEQGKKLHYLYGSASLINAFTFCLCKARWFHIKLLFEKACLSWEWLTQNIDNMETHIDTKCRKVNLNIWTQTWDHNVLWILWWSIHSVWKGIVYSLRCSIVSIYPPSIISCHHRHMYFESQIFLKIYLSLYRRNTIRTKNGNYRHWLQNLIYYCGTLCSCIVM